MAIEGVTSGVIKDFNPVKLAIRGSHGAPVLGFNTLYAKGDFGSGILQLYGSPHGEFDAAFPYPEIALSGPGAVAFLGRADSLWLRVENAQTVPDIQFWVM